MEIERKFLVKAYPYRSGVHAERIIQGYLNSAQERTVRVRVKGERAWLTIKSLTIGISREEFEYAIPIDDAKRMLALCELPLLEKDRFVFEEHGLRWEVDEFRGANEGLIVAEIELTDAQVDLALPDWIGPEVSHDVRYFNSNLMKDPYCNWKREPLEAL